MFTNLNNVKSYLKVGDSTYDTVLSGLVTLADSIISDRLNQDLNAGSHIEIRDGNNDYMMFLKSYPVNSLTSVEQWDGDEWTAVDSSNYSLVTTESIAKIRRTDAPFYSGEMNWRLTYNRGYSTIPLPVQQVATELVAIMFKESSMKTASDGRLGVSGETHNYGGVADSIQFKSEWDKWDMYLNKYRIPTV